MAELMLAGARWLKNHGVSLRYARGRKTARLRYVRPDGALTFGEAAKLLGVSRMWLYRLRDSGMVKTRNHGHAETVALAELRRVQAELGRDRRHRKAG